MSGSAEVAIYEHVEATATLSQARDQVSLYNSMILDGLNRPLQWTQS